MYLIASVGIGKTSLAKRIHDELREHQSKQVVFSFAPNLKTSNAFPCFVIDDFGVKTSRNYAVSPGTSSSSCSINTSPALLGAAGR